jgi:hypothetical protein
VSRTPETLAQRCQNLFDGAGQAITWVNDVRGSAQRLDRDADGLTERLRRSRNLARRLSKAAQRPMSIGFFGLSQAGKSYLISSLARGANGDLETVLDGQRLDFIDHINPPGGGKEATGLVTRFTRKVTPTTPGFPVQLALLSEADLIKIFGNSFLLDFDRERVNFDLTPEQIRDRLNALKSRRLPAPTGGLSEDDVVDLSDYFDRRFKKSNEPLSGVFWPTAMALAPYLNSQDRAQLFALIWGDLPEFTTAYQMLRDALSRLSYAEDLHAPQAALVETTAAGLEQTNSIMNVDAVRVRFGKADADTIQVLPVVDGQPQAAVEMPRWLIAALTREMIFTLAEAPRVDMLESVDLLDFPGYRGRMGITSVSEAASADEGADPVGTLLLRGKVAYLFERYTDDQEMNVLVLCNPSDKQIEITALGPVLDSWVAATQGATAQERARRPPGLLWALTMFDKRLSDSMGQNESTLDMKWDGMVTLALLERFGKAAWVQEWSHDKPFNNLYLVRKPGMSKGIFEQDGETERAVRDEVRPDIDRMRATFIANAAVKRHVADPGAAWDTMIGIDDGGLGRLVNHMRTVAKVEYKLDRIGEQIDQIQRDLTETQLGSYYRADGADAVERKKKISDLILTALRKHPALFGELVRSLQPSSERLHSLYLQAESDTPDGPEEQAPQKEAPPASPFAGGGLISLDLGFPDDANDPLGDGNASHAPSTAKNGPAAQFARNAISDWIKQLRRLPDSLEVQTFFGLSNDILHGLVDEIITGSMRFGLEDKLVDALNASGNHAGATRSMLAHKQVLVVTTTINDFIDGMGYSALPLDKRPASVAAPGQVLFQPPINIPRGTLPKLAAAPINYTAIYILDWFEAFRALTIGNAGHALGSEFTPEQNQRLGVILNTIAGTLLGATATSAGA